MLRLLGLLAAFARTTGAYVKHRYSALSPAAKVIVAVSVSAVTSTLVQRPHQVLLFWLFTTVSFGLMFMLLHAVFSTRDRSYP